MRALVWHGKEDIHGFLRGLASAHGAAADLLKPMT